MLTGSPWGTSDAVLPFPPDAVVFDLDGVLVDSEAAWGRAERRVVEESGRPWDPSVRTLLLGKGPLEAAQVLANHLGVGDVREMDRRFLQAAVSEFRRGISPLPGSMRLLEGFQGRLKQGVATNSRRVLADLSLTSAGLASLVDVLVCVEDVPRPKPFPDSYLRACELLGADPARSVCVEDSPVGAAAAKAAGMWVIGCPSFTGALPEAADVVVSSLEDLDPLVFLNGAGAGH